MPVVKPRSFGEMKDLFNAETARLARLYEAHLENYPDRPAYLMGCRHTGLDTQNPGLSIWTCLGIYPEGEEPEGWERVRPDPLPDPRATGIANFWGNYLHLLRSWLGREPLWLFAD